MKLVRLFLMSGLAFAAFSGVAAAAEVPPPPPPLTASVMPTVVSTTVSTEGTTTTYSDGLELFKPYSPDTISECEAQHFCLWENINFSGGKAQWHDSGYWQAVPGNFYASSFYNNRNNCSYIMAANGQERTFPAQGAGNFGEEWNDRAREVYLSSSAIC